MGGEAKLKETATRRFVSQYPDCCFCAGKRPATTREHMPPKALFNGSHRPDKLVMPACGDCNRGTSTADLVASLISRWGRDITDVELSDHNKLAKRIMKQAPALRDEWLSEANNKHFAHRARMHLRKHGVDVSIDDAVVTVGPATIGVLNLFAHKATLALFFEHFKRPLSEEMAYSAYWRTKEDLARGRPEDFLKLLPEYATLTQGRWSTGDIFEYRFGINEAERLFAYYARLRQGLVVWGFAMPADQVDADDENWVRPGELLDLVNTERFSKKS